MLETTKVRMTADEMFDYYERMFAKLDAQAKKKGPVAIALFRMVGVFSKFEA